MARRPRRGLRRARSAKTRGPANDHVTARLDSSQPMIMIIIIIIITIIIIHLRARDGGGRAAETGEAGMDERIRCGIVCSFEFSFVSLCHYTAINLPLAENTRDRCQSLDDSGSLMSERGYFIDVILLSPLSLARACVFLSQRLRCCSSSLFNIIAAPDSMIQ